MVTLDVSVTWIDPETQEYHTEPESFARSAANALREFAPGATFYARGLEILIDAVDLGPDDSSIRTMAFCPNCGFAAELSGPGPGGAAAIGVPAVRRGRVVRDGAPPGRGGAEQGLLAGPAGRGGHRRPQRRAHQGALHHQRLRRHPSGQRGQAVVRQRLRLRHQVPAATGDPLGERRQGRARPVPADRRRQVQAPLFRVCEGCGVLDREAGTNRPEEHRAWCRYRKDPDEHVRSIALGRTLTTQGAVIRLPQSVTIGDQFAVPSLGAALLLGLHEQIGGSPDHINIAAISEPIGHDGLASEALLLHDLVPGGTGYLAELANPERMWDLLHRAWVRVRDCPCQHEQRLACHRCLVPFAPDLGRRPQPGLPVGRGTAPARDPDLRCPRRDARRRR